MKEYNELIRGEMSPYWKSVNPSYLKRYEKCMHIERLIDLVNRQIKAGINPDYDIYKLCVDLGFKCELEEIKKSNKMEVNTMTTATTAKTHNKYKGKNKSQLREMLIPYVNMAKEREKRGYAVKDIARIYGISVSDYYLKLKMAREIGLGNEIPAYTGKYSKKASRTKSTSPSKTNNSSNVSPFDKNKNIIRIAKGNTVVSVSTDVSQDVITKLVRALIAC